MSPGGTELGRDGLVMLPECLSGGEVESLRVEAAHLQLEAGRVCVRDILRRSERILNLAIELAGGRCPPLAGLVPVRGILFDKTPDENWPVGWHQDLSIALAGRTPARGYSGWTVKGGVTHAQAPVELLEGMVTLRLHLDDTPGENGALRVAPGTHRAGKLTAAAIPALVEHGGECTCACSAGDGLLMKPLILHSSPRSHGPGAGRHRRVIHLEFAQAGALAEGLEWYERPRPGISAPR